MHQHVVLLGSANNSSNLGDECMWEAAAGVVRNAFPDMPIITDSQDPRNWKPPVSGVQVEQFLYPALQRGYARTPWLVDHFKLAHQVLSKPKALTYASRRLNKALAGQSNNSLERRWEHLIRGSRAVIFSGAGAITDDYAVHGIYSWRLLTEYAKRHGVPVAFLGQGIGPVVDGTARVHAAAMLSAAQLITVREERSAAVLRDLGIAGGLVEGDWALLLSPTHEDDEAAKQTLGRMVSGRPFVALSLHRRADTTEHDLQDYRDLAARVLQRAHEDGHDVVFVPNMTKGRYSDDRVTADRVRSLLPRHLRDRLLVVRERLTAGATKSLLGHAELLITTRYHPLIFAMSSGTPTIGASLDPYYDQKLTGASEIFGVRDNVARVLKVPDLLDSHNVFRNNSRLQPNAPDPTSIDKMRDRLVGFIAGS